MRRAVRVAGLILFAYLMQSTVLPHLKIGGLMIEYMVITLFTIGYACGYYAGLVGGVFCALLMESLSGDLPGLTSAICVGAGAFGAWLATRLQAFEKPGRRRLEVYVKRFTPMVAIVLFVALKETIYIVYFYLTGTSIVFGHWLKMVLAGLLAGVFSLVLLPLTYNFLLRSPESTYMARQMRKRRMKKKPKEVEPVTKPQGVPAEGGMDT